MSVFLTPLVMKRSLSTILIGVLGVLPLVASARTYDTSHLPYSDAPEDRETAVAVSVLTEENILFGNPDRTFRPDALLNRAEFMQIAMRLLGPDTLNLQENCFPDVSLTAWYAQPVCRAKLLGIVRGNAVEGVPENEWRFEPSRSVHYEEAVKVLVNLYALPTGVEETGTSADWYVPYIEAAQNANLSISALRPGDTITRGEMARLVANFYANAYGELDLLRSAQSGSSSSSSSVSSSSSSSVSSVSSTSSSTSSSSSSSVILDPLGDTTIRSNFILLGTTSPILGSANILSTGEPIDVDSFYLDLLDANSSISGFLVYNENQQYIGRATLDSSISGNRRYRVSVSNKNIVIEQNKEYSFYVRAETRSPDNGGVGGVPVRIDSLGVQGTGVWSSNNYTKLSTETFLTYQTADAVIERIDPVGETNSPLVAGPSRDIAAFTIEGAIAANSADLRITDLEFYASKSSNVSLTNIYLRRKDDTTLHACNLASNVITCSSIPASIGTVEDSPNTDIELLADVVIADGSTNGSLQITLIEPGSPSSSGDVTWTDGDTTFTWVAEESPVARATYYSF